MDRVPATLVLPPGKGPFAGILFGHWMMPRSPVRNRKEFLEEALLLARSGAASFQTSVPISSRCIIVSNEPRAGMKNYNVLAEVGILVTGLSAESLIAAEAASVAKSRALFFVNGGDSGSCRRIIG